MKNFLPRNIFEEEHNMFREACRDFVNAEVAPHVERWHEQGYCDRSLFEKAGQQGLLGMMAPEEFGGGGQAGDYRFNAILSEELANADSGSVIVLSLIHI